MHAKLYRCVMKVDCEELMFDDCVPSATYVKDFNIWNLSEIGTSISLIHSVWPSVWSFGCGAPPLCIC